MLRKPLLWQLFPSYVVIIALSLAAVTWHATSSMREFHRDEVRAELEARARLIEKLVVARMDTDAIEALCKDLGKRSATRITVVLTSGKVVADSDEDPARMENHAAPDRPEIMSALAGEVGVAIRQSTTLDKNMMYLAIPLRRGEDLVGVVRTAMPVTAIEAALESVHRKLARAGLVVGVVAGLLSLFISHRVSKPLEEMKRGALKFARGELDSRLTVPGTEELAGLAEAMNEMAAQLGERLRTITEQRNRQEAILSSMGEGVLAIDTEERLISLNGAAARMLGVPYPAQEGRSIQEVVRNLGVQRLVTRTLSQAGPTEGEAVLAGNGETVVQMHGAPLRDAQGLPIGAVLVLNDVTRLRRLEDVRREFVANVSHELRTPITSIKGFVETLLEGALHAPKDAERFLGVIAKQAERLDAIIGDLLLLSRVEEGEKAGLPREEAALGGVLQGALAVCELKATEKNVSLQLDCQQGLTANVNAALIEQAVVNLADNAIKYSEPGSTVEVEATSAESEIVIRVRDHGCGIETRHLPRLFERFYRADKARSRKLGGTGLGLSIVKHIAQAHGGRVEVESTPGQGSTFSIHLPK